MIHVNYGVLMIKNRRRKKEDKKDDKYIKKILDLLDKDDKISEILQSNDMLSFDFDFLDRYQNEIDLDVKSSIIISNECIYESKILDEDNFKGHA